MKPRDLVMQWVEAFNRADPEALVRGKGAIRAMFANGFASALRGCGFFHVVNGKIAFQRGYWDKLSFLRQQGLPLPME
jgi:hypothetical protein